MYSEHTHPFCLSISVRQTFLVCCHYFTLFQFCVFDFCWDILSRDSHSANRISFTINKFICQCWAHVKVISVETIPLSQQRVHRRKHNSRSHRQIHIFFHVCCVTTRNSSISCWALTKLKTLYQIFYIWLVYTEPKTNSPFTLTMIHQ